MIRKNCEVCNVLEEKDIEKIEQLPETVEMISEILGADVFINCATRDKDETMVVFHAKPKCSIYHKNITGAIATSKNEPAVYRSFMTGKSSKNYKGISQEKKNIVQNVVPIKNSKHEVIAVIIIEVEDKNYSRINIDTINSTTKSLLKELDKSRDRISDFIKDGVVVFNEIGKVVYSNSVAEKIYSKIGISQKLKGKTYENITLSKINISDILNSKETQKIIEVDISNINLSITYYLMKYEKTDIVMIIRDVTKERNNEKELMLKSVAIKEIHHRVKNNLQTIASLLRIQLRRIENVEAKIILKDTIDRVLSISITHEILSKKGFDNIYIKTVIRLIYENFKKTSIDKSKKIELNVIGKDYRINSETATSIALVLNEILQNAIKHAFTNRENGKINVEIDGDKPFKKIIVSDNGVGIKSLNYEDSLGLMIVNKIMKDKLKGDVCISSSTNGTVVKLEFKNII